MNDAESTAGPDPLWGEATGLAYSPAETESVYRSLVRIRAADALDDTEADPAGTDPRPFKPWLDCDPEGRVLSEVYGEWARASAGFHDRIRPASGSTASSYVTLSALHARLRGKGNLRTPQGGEPIGRFGYWLIAEETVPEIYEAVARVIANGSSVPTAALASMNGRYGWGGGCHGDGEYERRLDYVSKHAERLLDEEQLTAEDSLYVYAVWRRDLRVRLLAFARFEALARALDDFERDELFERRGHVVTPGRAGRRQVTVAQAGQALMILDVLRGLRAPVKSYEDLGREVERSGDFAGDKDGTSVVKGAKRALVNLGETPTVGGLADMLGRHEGHFRCVVAHGAAGRE